MATKNPRVQVQINGTYHGLSVGGEFYNAIPKEYMDNPESFYQTYGSLRDYLPPEASRAYWAHYDVDNPSGVYQCQECGYLSTSSKCGPASTERKICTECGSSKWRKVFPRDALVTVPDEHKDKVYVDILSLEKNDVPNNPSHLSRIQNQYSGYLSRNEMLDRVSEVMGSDY